MILSCRRRSGRIGELSNGRIFRAFAFNAGITLHIRQLAGDNTHHILEASFKAWAHALKQAVTVDLGIDGTLSTKGGLDL